MNHQIGWDGEYLVAKLAEPTIRDVLRVFAAEPELAIFAGAIARPFLPK